jgi:hypothetical protein
MSGPVPAAEVIGTITKLSDGYVVTIRGATKACKDARDLGKSVEKMARKLKPLPGPQDESPNTKMLKELESAWNAGFASGREQATPLERQDREEESPGRQMASVQAQVGNLRAMAAARAQGLLSSETFYEKVARFCPDLSDAMVQQALDEADKLRMPGQAPVCECAQGPCPQNVSVPNARGLCMGCMNGEHLHPVNGQVDPDDMPVRVVPQGMMMQEIDGFVPVQAEDGDEVEMGPVS